MKLKILASALMISILSGCASVPLEDSKTSNKAKEFKVPTNDKSGLYIYRSGGFGGALKKDIWVDGECIGESAPNVFFYVELLGDKDYKVSTESEFSPNDLIVQIESGKNYFVRQYMKFGAFVGGAGLELIDEEKGKKEVSKLKMAKQGKCS
ncbi:DUF2846 domain-containing protein [Shewanella sp. Isolate11]|uniref:DUF2846 domain-containing protein n=1 Tax=Shewanella sp. Isolate11 TaxID=2908530 RepID=UPI001EFCB480|nr:DUF2846 domain-containing protein [Shewanella sp. Isolate11]MCG9697618.1 DUF2846 domain-containing protein [Shewanella sp. Isolate11]